MDDKIRMIIFVHIHIVVEIYKVNRVLRFVQRKFYVPLFNTYLSVLKKKIKQIFFLYSTAVPNKTKIMWKLNANFI